MKKYFVVAYCNKTQQTVTLSKPFYTKKEATNLVKKREKDDKATRYPFFSNYRVLEQADRSYHVGDLYEKLEALADEFDENDILNQSIKLLSRSLDTSFALSYMKDFLEENGFICIKVDTQREEQIISEFIDQSYTHNQTPLF